MHDGPNEVWQFLAVSGDLLAASGRGLYKIENESAVRINGSSSNTYSLGTSKLWPDHVFVGLMGGIEVFKHEAGKWITLGRLPGIQENIRRITTDADGDLWLNTEVQGVIRVHFSGDRPTKIATHKIGLENGLPDLTNCRNSYIAPSLFLLCEKGVFSASIPSWSDSKTDAIHFEKDARFGSQYSDGSISSAEITSDGKDGLLLRTSIGVQWLALDQHGQYQIKGDAFRGLTAPAENLYVDEQGAVWLAGEELYRV
jgi:hypothetical protein